MAKISREQLPGLYLQPKHLDLWVPALGSSYAVAGSLALNVEGIQIVRYL